MIRFTVLKALREKVYLLFLLITLVVIAAAGSVSFYQTGVQIKFVKDVALLTVSLFGFLLTLFVCAELLPQELETGGLQFLVSRPLSRPELVVAKYLAFLTLLVLNVGPLILEVLSLIALYSGKPDWNAFRGCLLILFELSVFGVMVLFLSTFLTRVITLFGALFLYAASNLSQWFTDTFIASSPMPLQVAVRIVMAVLPDLSHFDSRYVVVHQYDIPPLFVLLLALHAALYVTAFLAASSWILEAREL